MHTSFFQILLYAATHSEQQSSLCTNQG